MNLFNLYGGNEEMTKFFDVPLKNIHEDASNWNTVIQNHILRLNQSIDGVMLPRFPDDLEWINTDQYLTYNEHFKGKVIVLNFFTYSCLKCENMLPFIKSFEESYAENHSVALIGVHSPKYTNQKDVKNVKDAVLRNNIKHLVLHDPENSLWKEFEIFYCPTVLIIHPTGKVLFCLMGKNQVEKLTHLVGQSLKFLESQNYDFNICPLPVKAIKDTQENNILRYPRNISINGDLGVISDTGHHRLILISVQEAVILHIIGSGTEGSDDGSFSEASFTSPHGTAWMSFIIFVADTGNHSIRAIDLRTKKVSTIFNGKVHNENVANSKFLSPWDICIAPQFVSKQQFNALYIAVAGSNQIWTIIFLDPSLDQWYKIAMCTPFAGSGREECRNSTSSSEAGFAQPSGISYSKSHPEILFVVDSESSCVRSVSLLSGATSFVVGGSLYPGDLLQFGNVDGRDLDVKLQHPLGICIADNDGKIFIADTYNNKIKSVDSKTQACHTVNLVDDDGNSASFLEPSGLCFTNDMTELFICDTNNHRIKYTYNNVKRVIEMNLHYPQDNVCMEGNSYVYNHHGESTFIDLNPQKIQEITIGLKPHGVICCHFIAGSGKYLLNKTSDLPWNVSFQGNCKFEVNCSGALFGTMNQPALTFNCQSEDSCETAMDIEVSAPVHEVQTNTCFEFVGNISIKICISENGNDMHFLGVTLP